MMTTLESFFAQTLKNKFNLIQEEEPIFKDEIQLENGSQPLIIYEHDNPAETVDTFCKYNEVSPVKKQ